MKGFYFLLLLGLALASCSKADSNGPAGPGNQTGCPSMELAGGTISGALSNCNAIYQVRNTLTVPADSTLVIEPGIRLLFTSDAGLIVQGRLLGIGDNLHRIQFLRATDAPGWRGITFMDGTAMSELAFCNIERILIPDNDSEKSGGIEVIRSNLVMRNCIVRLNTSTLGGGLYVVQSTVNLTNSVFRENQATVTGGAGLFLESTAQITNNTFYNNTSINQGGGLVFGDQDLTGLQNNIFYENEGTAGDPRFELTTGDAAFMEQYNYLSVTTDPGFVNAADDLHLTTLAAAKDQGNPDSAYNDVDGTRNDQGAYGGPGGDW